MQTNRRRWRQTNAIFAVELAEDAKPLTMLGPATSRSLILLGHEHHGAPDEMVAIAVECVEIPMIGHGASLNVADAGSLVLYRLAGLA